MKERRKMKKIISLILTVGFIFTLCSCGWVSRLIHGAKSITEGVVFTEAFLQESKVKNAFCAKFGESIVAEYSRDENLPEERTFAVTSKEEEKEIFEKLPNIDYDREIIIVCCFFTHMVDVRFVSAKVEEDTLKIEVKNKKSGGVDGYTRIVVIQMKKVKFKEIELVVDHSSFFWKRRV